MAIAWGLKYNGSSTVTLNVMDYNQAVPADGEEFVTETVPVNVVGTSVSDLDADRTLLNQLCYAVAEYQKSKVLNKPVYLTGTIETIVWRSEIVAMKVVNASSLAWTSEHAENVRAVNLEITRRAYWETDTQHNAQLKNADSDWSAGVNGIPIFLGDDRSGGAAPAIVTNYVFTKENASAPKMDMPSPVKIVLLDGPATVHDRFFFGSKSHCAYAGTDAFNTSLLVEYSGAADVSSSGDEHESNTFVTGSDTMLSADTFDPADALLQENMYYKAILRFADVFAYTDLRVRMVILDRVFDVAVFTGQWHTLTAGDMLYPLDTFKLPAQSLYDDSYVNYRFYELQLEFSSAVASRTVKVDYVQFIGAADYVEVEKLADYAGDGLGVSNAYTMAFDFSTNPFSVICNTTVAANPTTGYAVFTHKGSAIRIFPDMGGVYSTAIFVHQMSNDGTLNFPDNGCSIAVLYRPRRRAL